MQYTSLQEIEHYSAWNVSDPERVLGPSQVIQNVASILESYSMILVTERMDESLVCLALLLGVDVGDVLVMPSKVSGGSNNYHLLRFRGPKWVCQYMMKAEVSHNVSVFLSSDYWRSMNYGDYLLHSAANKSLDLTISALQPKFDIAMSRYRRLQDLAVRNCASEAIYPCSATGEPQVNLAKKSCYGGLGGDKACGYKCINRMLANETNFLPA